MLGWLNNKKIKIVLFCFFISFISITICSKNSFLYPFNNWPDENAFMTVGKSWYYGMIPYKDIFEQKGPLLYFIFMLCYMISHNSFIGVYLLELVSFTVCLYYISKIIRLYLSDKMQYLIVPLFASIIVSSPFFAHGGSAEEFCLPLLSFMIYSLLNYDKNDIITNKTLFLNGLFAGLVAMIKFNLLGFWGIFMASIFISLITKKEWKKSFISCLIFLSGMFIPIFAFILYFYLNHGLEELIKTYLLFNASGYGNTASITEKIVPILRMLFLQMSSKFIIFNLIYLGLFVFVSKKDYIKSIIIKVTLIFTYIIGGIGIYFGLQPFIYYFLILTLYIIFGLIVLFNYLITKRKFNYIFMLIVVIIISFAYLLSSNNIYYMKCKKNKLPQYRFAKIINKTKNAKILNYSFLDGGFYMASDILPSTKYFQALNANVPGMYEELDKKIEKKYFDYVIVRTYDGHRDISKVLLDNYYIIDKQSEKLENIKFTYIILKKNKDK